MESNASSSVSALEVFHICVVTCNVGMRIGSDCVLQQGQGPTPAGPEEVGDLPYFTQSFSPGSVALSPNRL